MPKAQPTPPAEPEIDIDLVAKTLTGDIQSFLIDRIRRLPRTFDQMTEQDQADQIHAAQSAAFDLVRKTVETIASAGRKVVLGDLEQVTVKDGAKAVIKLSKSSEHLHELIDSTGQRVLIVVAGTEEFTGERDAVKPEPDQPDMLKEAA